MNKTVLHHLYINPLGKCNLKCKICYTRKTSPILSETEIITFIDRYNQEVKVQTITLCGGEIFALPYISHLVNTLTQKGIIVQIITNGTIDRLSEFDIPNFVNLIVSLDGLEQYHNANRGVGNFRKSSAFISKAQRLGFHTELFSIVTKQNLKEIDIFEDHMRKLFGDISITYHPRKPMRYLSNHPISNIVGHVEGFDFLNDDEMVKLMKTRNTFPPKELGCYQISVESDGKVYGCCEGYIPIGSITDDISKLIKTLEGNIGGPCQGCSQQDFMCGIKHIISQLSTIPFYDLGGQEEPLNNPIINI